MKFTTQVIAEGPSLMQGEALPKTDMLYDVEATMSAAKAMMEADSGQLDGAEKARMLPQPTGYRLLCALPKVAEKTSGGVFRPDSIRDREEVASALLLVLAMGPDCYGDTKRFPSGPFCKTGDFILVRPYAGTRFKVLGQEFRIINDDEVSGVIEDPRGFSRF